MPKIGQRTEGKISAKRRGCIIHQIMVAALGPKNNNEAQTQHILPPLLV